MLAAPFICTRELASCSRSEQENFNLIINFIHQDLSDKHIPSKTCRSEKDSQEEQNARAKKTGSDKFGLNSKFLEGK